MRRWLRSGTEGANFLEGIELLRTWDEDVERDLVALKSENDDEDALSAWFTPRLVSAYHYVFQSVS